MHWLAIVILWAHQANTANKGDDMSDDDRSYTAYWKYVRAAAREAVDNVLENIEYDDEFNEHIHETVNTVTDCVDWVIYTHHATRLMMYTDNPDAFYEATGTAVPTGVDGWSGLVTIMASYALLADTLDCAFRTYDGSLMADLNEKLRDGQS